MKTHEFEFNGKQHRLIYNAAAMFEINDMLAEGEDLFKLLGESTARAFDISCKVLQVMSQQARIVDKFSCREPLPEISYDEIHALASAIDMVKIRGEIVKVITAGVHRDEVQTGPIDLDLMEANSKNA